MLVIALKMAFRAGASIFIAAGGAGQRDETILSEAKNRP
jgi:hypothetical protein